MIAALALILLVPGAAAAGDFLKATHDGRAYRLFVPEVSQPEAPLVLALHGCWQTPEDFATGTRLNAAAERLGLTVLYPAQTRRVLGLALSAALNAPPRPTRYGVFRM